MLTARDKKLKLSGKSLTEHLCRKHGAHKDVGAAFMLHEIQQDDNPTPRQAITKYTNSLTHKERIKDRYPRGGIDDIRKSKSLLNWLAISRLPDNLLA